MRSVPESSRCSQTGRIFSACVVASDAGLIRSSSSRQTEMLARRLVQMVFGKHAARVPQDSEPSSLSCLGRILGESFHRLVVADADGELFVVGSQRYDSGAGNNLIVLEHESLYCISGSLCRRVLRLLVSAVRLMCR